MFSNRPNNEENSSLLIKRAEQKAESNEWRSTKRMPVMYHKGDWGGGQDDCREGEITTGMCAMCVC